MKKFEDVRGTGVIRGRIRFEGRAPEMSVVSSGAKCHPGAADVREETVEVSNSGGLKNVLVHVESAALSAIDGSTLPPVVIDQRDCRYVPHVAAVCVNQPVRITSSDAATMHNVHYAADRNESRNFSMTDKGQEKVVTFASAETIRLRCDVHPWMAAMVGVFDTPFSAVTDAEGAFAIEGLPPGEYKLIAWHERYGELTQTLNVKSESPAQIDMTYKAP